LKNPSQRVGTGVAVAAGLAAGLAGVVLAGAPAGPASPDDIVPINGPAYLGSRPTGPDLTGVRLTAFQARNPRRAVLDATRAQRADDVDAIPLNVQASRSGVVKGASRRVNDHSEVMLAIDPTDPLHLLGGSKFFYRPESYDFYTGVFESTDGGLTWAQEQPPGVQTYGLTSDPVNTFDDAGNGYFTLLTRRPGGLTMSKKPVGRNWEQPVVVVQLEQTDKQWIAADQDPEGTSPYAGNLYMSWTQFAVGAIEFNRSVDGNRTWSPTIRLATGRVQGSIPGVAPDGTVYVVYGVDVFGGTPGEMRFVKSTNGGRTFTSSALAADIRSIPGRLPNGRFRNSSLPGFAVSPADGSLYVVWSDYRNGDADIYMTRSSDGGDAWSAPVRLNDDPEGNGVDQIMPQVSVAPGGRVAVMWLDRRMACPDLPWIDAARVGAENTCIDTYLTRSTDGGATWAPNLRVSAQTWDPAINLPIVSGDTGFIGDYQGIASSETMDFPFWNATADLGANPDRYQQIFVARVPVEPIPEALSASTFTAAPAEVLPGETARFELALRAAGASPLPTVTVRFELPRGGEFDFLSLASSSGVLDYEVRPNTVTWTGGVEAAKPVTISFDVRADAAARAGDRLTAIATITDGERAAYLREASARVAAAPTPTPSPAPPTSTPPVETPTATAAPGTATPTAPASPTATRPPERRRIYLPLARRGALPPAALRAAARPRGGGGLTNSGRISGVR